MFPYSRRYTALGFEGQKSILGNTKGQFMQIFKLNFSVFFIINKTHWLEGSIIFATKFLPVFYPDKSCKMGVLTFLLKKCFSENKNIKKIYNPTQKYLK